MWVLGFPVPPGVRAAPPLIAYLCRARPDLGPEHDIFIQHLKLKNTLRLLMNEEVLDHSGLDYYDPEKGLPTPASAAKPLPKSPTKGKPRLLVRH